MAVQVAQVVVTQDCVAAIAEEHDLVLPATLRPEPVFRRKDEAHARRESAHAELADEGVSVGTFAGLLRVLCSGGQEFYGYVHTTELDYTLHVAASGRDAVFAVLATQQARVLLRSARPESLVAELLAELPECPPAHGRSLSAPEADLRGPGADDMHDPPVPRGEARRVAELLRRPRLAEGQLFTGIRDGRGVRHSNQRNPLVFIDAEDGRWLTYRTQDGSGNRFVVATPGSRESLSTKLRETQQAL